MRTKDTNKEVKNTDQDTDDSEDLESNISGVVEPQNKILCQIEMNPVKKNLEMHGGQRGGGGPQGALHCQAGRPILHIYEVDEQKNKILYQNETNSVKMGLKILEKNRREEGGPQEVPH